MSKWHHYNNPNFKNKVCCANCIHLYDESNTTACILHDWMKTTFDNSCDNFEGGIDQYEVICDKT